MVAGGCCGSGELIFGLRGDREQRGSGDIALSHQDGGATDSLAVLHDAHALRGCMQQYQRNTA